MADPTQKIRYVVDVHKKARRIGKQPSPLEIYDYEIIMVEPHTRFMLSTKTHTPWICMFIVSFQECGARITDLIALRLNNLPDQAYHIPEDFCGSIIICKDQQK